jgi:hypothetical protein
MDRHFESEIKRIAREKKYVVLSNHAIDEADKDGIDMKEIIESINNGELIEDYPVKHRTHDCLFSGQAQGKQIHSVCTIIDEDIFVITTYIPTLDKWHSDYKTRRQR